MAAELKDVVREATLRLVRRNEAAMALVETMRMNQEMIDIAHNAALRRTTCPIEILQLNEVHSIQTRLCRTMLLCLENTLENS